MRINIASFHPRPYVRGEEPHPTRGDRVCAEDLTEQTFKNSPQSYGMSVVPMGRMVLRKSADNDTLWDTRPPPRCT
jgi:hypothetical protein